MILASSQKVTVAGVIWLLDAIANPGSLPSMKSSSSSFFDEPNISSMLLSGRRHVLLHSYCVR
jgi:hypothetical protein